MLNGQQKCLDFSVKNNIFSSIIAKYEYSMICFNEISMKQHGKLLFDNKYNESVKISRETFHALYSIYNHFLGLILELKEEIIREYKASVDAEFNLVFLQILNRTIQHTESIILLTERGLYGDAFALYRNILSDSNMFYYLHFKPELIDMFFSENEESYQAKNSDFKKNFSEYAIATELKNRGVSSTKNIFDLFSKAAHTSAFGAQLYSRRSSNNQDRFHLKYGPGLERERAMIILFITMQIHKDLINGIIWHRMENKLDVSSGFWLNILEKIGKMDHDISKLTSITTSLLDELEKNRTKK